MHRANNVIVLLKIKKMTSTPKQDQRSSKFFKTFGLLLRPS